MRDFVHQENLARYRRLLEQTDDPGERARLKQLLAEEECSGDTAGPEAKSRGRDGSN
jgi:hypothetical protein